jgi:hypothetical protein
MLAAGSAAMNHNPLPDGLAEVGAVACSGGISSAGFIR